MQGKILFLVLALLLSGVGACHADSILVGTTTAYCTNCYGISDYSALAQQFSLSETSTVDLISLGLSGSGSFTVFLTDGLIPSPTSHYSPSGPVYVTYGTWPPDIYFTGTVDNPVNGTSFNTSLVLNPGTYYLVATGDSLGTNGTWTAAPFRPVQAPIENYGTVADGHLFTVTPGGLAGQWNDANSGIGYPPLLFQIDGTVPEPPGIVLLASGLLFIGAMRAWRSLPRLSTAWPVSKRNRQFTF